MKTIIKANLIVATLFGLFISSFFPFSTNKTSNKVEAQSGCSNLDVVWVLDLTNTMEFDFNSATTKLAAAKSNITAANTALSGNNNRAALITFAAGVATLDQNFSADLAGLNTLVNSKTSSSNTRRNLSRTITQLKNTLNNRTDKALRRPVVVVLTDSSPNQDAAGNNFSTYPSTSNVSAVNLYTTTTSTTFRTPSQVSSSGATESGVRAGRALGDTMTQVQDILDDGTNGLGSTGKLNAIALDGTGSQINTRNSMQEYIAKAGDNVANTSNVGVSEKPGNPTELQRAFNNVFSALNCTSGVTPTPTTSPSTTPTATPTDVAPATQIVIEYPPATNGNDVFFRPAIFELNQSVVAGSQTGVDSCDFKSVPDYTSGQFYLNTISPAPCPTLYSGNDRPFVKIDRLPAMENGNGANVWYYRFTITSDKALNINPDLVVASRASKKLLSKLESIFSFRKNTVEAYAPPPAGNIFHLLKPTFAPSPSATPTTSPTPSPTPSVTPSVTPSPSPTVTVTPSPTATATSGITPTPTPSVTTLKTLDYRTSFINDSVNANFTEAIIGNLKTKLDANNGRLRRTTDNNSDLAFLCENNGIFELNNPTSICLRSMTRFMIRNKSISLYPPIYSPLIIPLTQGSLSPGIITIEGNVAGEAVADFTGKPQSLVIGGTINNVNGVPIQNQKAGYLSGSNLQWVDFAGQMNNLFNLRSTKGKPYGTGNLTIAANATWNLNEASNNPISNTSSNTNTTPAEGLLWNVGATNMTFNGPITFRGSGTIAINGNVIFNDEVRCTDAKRFALIAQTITFKKPTINCGAYVALGDSGVASGSKSINFDFSLVGNVHPIATGIFIASKNLVLPDLDSIARYDINYDKTLAANPTVLLREMLQLIIKSGQ